MLKSRVFVVVGALARALGVAASSEAATPGAAFGRTYMALAALGDGQREAYVFGYEGEQTSTIGPVDDEPFVCASVARREDNLIDWGCDFFHPTVDPLLRGGMIKVTIPSSIHKIDTFEYLEESDITIQMTWTGRGLYGPVVSHSENMDVNSIPSAYLHLSIGAGAERQASATGSVSSPELGTVSGTTRDASLINSANASAYMH